MRMDLVTGKLAGVTLDAIGFGARQANVIVPPSRTSSVSPSIAATLAHAVILSRGVSVTEEEAVSVYWSTLAALTPADGE